MQTRPPAPGVRERRFEVRHVEVAHAPGADLPGPEQPVERLERLVEAQVVLGPVQEVAVQGAGIEALQRALAGADGAPAGGVLRHHLGDQEDLVAAPLNRLRNHLLHDAVAVELGGVDVGHAELDAPAQRGHDRVPIVVVDVPVPWPITPTSSCAWPNGRCCIGMLRLLV